MPSQPSMPSDAADHTSVLNFGKLALEPPSPFLSRPALLELLGKGARPKVVLVCAPAGSGKSTLVYQLLIDAGQPVVYYRLSHADADIPQFLSYLSAGLRRYEPTFGVKIGTFLADLQNTLPARTSLVEVFLHEVSRLARRDLWIVLDDYQQVDAGPSIPSLVSELVDALPSGARLLLVSRSLPSLPLSRWRVQGDLLEVGPTELAFSWSETQQFFYEVSGVHLGLEPLKAIFAKTQGWPAGLALASQIARLHPAEEAVRIVEGSGGSGSPIYDYLAEQVYRRQPPPVKEFLRRSSIFKYLSPDACNVLLGIQDSGQRLNELHREGLFLLPAGRKGHLFKYHQLFREFLLSKLQEEETPETIRSLRRTAGRTLEASRAWNEAIMQYAAGGDLASATELLVRFGEQTIESGRIQRVSRWLRALPEETVTGQPRLLMLKGLVALSGGDTLGALRIFERCAVLLKNEPDPQISLKVAKHAGLALHRQYRYRDAIKLYTEAMEADHGDLGARIDLQRGLGSAYCGSGQLERAEQQARQVLRELEVHARSLRRAASIKVDALRNLSRVKLLRGQLGDAIALGREAVTVSETEDAGVHQQVEAYCTLGAALAASGERQEAAEVLEQAKSRGAGFYPREKRWVEGWLGRVAADEGELDAAEEHYRNADDRFTDEFAFLLLRIGRVQESLRVAQEAVSSQVRLECPPAKAHSQVAYALGFEALGLRESAVRTIEQSARVLLDYGYGQRYASSCMRASELWRALGNEERCNLWLARWLGASRELELHHFHWWDPQIFVSTLSEALRHGIEVEYGTHLAIRKLQPEVLVALRGWMDGAQAESPAVSAPDLSGSRRLAASAGEFDPEHAIETCRDPDVRAAVQKGLDEGRLTDAQIAQLRGAFQLTWKEVQVFLSYHVEAAYGPSMPETRLRARVAEELGISENTLKVHVASVRRKLGLPHRIGTLGLITWEAEHGILSPDHGAFLPGNGRMG